MHPPTSTHRGMALNLLSDKSQTLLLPSFINCLQLFHLDAAAKGARNEKPLPPGWKLCREAPVLPQHPPLGEGDAEGAFQTLEILLF